MKNLYLATGSVTVIFGCEYNDNQIIYSDAKMFLKEEVNTNTIEVTSVKELTSDIDIPIKWKNAIPWGIDDDMIVEKYLKNLNRTKDPEFELYLKLKKKFEEKL